VVAELYNTRNVPAVFWIDEAGRIVRANDPVYIRRTNRETGKVTINERYLDGVRDWVRRGAASRWVTDAVETARRMGAPDAANAQALAHFRLGVYLHEQGRAEEAIAQFKRAHELKPENWNYKRQAWNLGDAQRDYGTNVMEAIRGPIPFYPPLQLPDPE
jgi:tetratricopeptide (TPR) repeat protein